MRLEDNRITKRHLDQIRNRLPTIDCELGVADNCSEATAGVNNGDSDSESDVACRSATLPTGYSRPNESVSAMPITPQSTTPLTPGTPFLGFPSQDVDISSPPFQATPRRSKRSRKAPELYSGSGR